MSRKKRSAAHGRRTARKTSSGKLVDFIKLVLVLSACYIAALFFTEPAQFPDAIGKNPFIVQSYALRDTVKNKFDGRSKQSAAPADTSQGYSPHERSKLDDLITNEGH